MNARKDAAICSGRTIHFVGIGGCGTSGLAMMLMARGATVSGSDQEASAVTNSLNSAGIHVTIGSAAATITPPVDLVVYSAAWRWEAAGLLETPC